MNLPNYKDRSIVNLMSSISKALGDKPKYRPLKSLNPKELSRYKNIIFLFIDGLGYEYLVKYGKGTTFYKYLKDKITSVFPATTATSVITFNTGLAPQEHAITGWTVFLKELGVVAKIIRFKPEIGGKVFSKLGINPKLIFDQEVIFNKIKAKSYAILPKQIVNSDLNKVIHGRAKLLGYNKLAGFFRQIKKVILSSNKKKFVYAYWWLLDNLIHEYGTKSRKVLNHFKEFDRKLALFLKSIEGTNTCVVITSDHGFVDVDKSKIVDLDKHPKLVETLTLPLCGEARAAYCYVHPSKTKQFENYVKNNFKNKCYMYKSEELVKKNYFGLFKPHKQLLDRIGDYVLIMKDNYIIKHFLLGKTKRFLKAYHGGVSKEEMFVPLVVVDK